MTTFALIHGGAGDGWFWHRVVEALRLHGHDAVAPDLPCDDAAATFDDYATAVVRALGDRTGDVVVVAHSYGGFTAPLVAARMPVSRIVLLSAMIPAPGESPADWWKNTGHAAAVKAQAARDGGLTGNDDPFVSTWNGVSRALAKEAQEHHVRGESKAAYEAPWPGEAWPDVPTDVLACADDRTFPPDFQQRVAKARLGLDVRVVPGGHAAPLGDPDGVAQALVACVSP